MILNIIKIVYTTIFFLLFGISLGYGFGSFMFYDIKSLIVCIIAASFSVYMIIYLMTHTYNKNI